MAEATPTFLFPGSGNPAEKAATPSQQPTWPLLTEQRPRIHDWSTTRQDAWKMAGSRAVTRSRKASHLETASGTPSRPPSYLQSSPHQKTPTSELVRPPPFSPIPLSHTEHEMTSPPTRPPARPGRGHRSQLLSGAISPRTSRSWSPKGQDGLGLRGHSRARAQAQACIGLYKDYPDRCHHLTEWPLWKDHLRVWCWRCCWHVLEGIGESQSVAMPSSAHIGRGVITLASF